MIEELEPRECFNRCKQSKAAVLIDVRSPEEFAEVHAEGARNIPLDIISAERLLEEQIGREQEIYIICRSGARSMKACHILAEQGFERLINVEGGTLAWLSCGLPQKA